METIKVINASQARSINIYKNAKTKLMRCYANIHFNKQCSKLQITPKYARVKLPRTSPASIPTQMKAQTIRIKDEIRFLYRKKQQLNLELYRGHLKVSTECGTPYQDIYTLPSVNTSASNTKTS
jgi:hypothetical protein